MIRRFGRIEPGSGAGPATGHTGAGRGGLATAGAVRFFFDLGFAAFATTLSRVESPTTAGGETAESARMMESGRGMESGTCATAASGRAHPMKTADMNPSEARTDALDRNGDI